MPFIQEDVDIYVRPTSIIPSQGQRVSIGDLHANAMKLTYMLVRHGVVTISEEHYNELVRIYRNIAAIIPEPKAFPLIVSMTWQPEINAEQRDSLVKDIACFNNIWKEQITINRDAIGSLEIIGDDKNDRGTLDDFIDKIFLALRLASVPFVILVSNHSIEAMTSYEHSLISDITPTNGYFFARSEICMIEPLQRISGIRSGFLIEQGIIPIQEAKDIYEQVYKPALLALNYSIDRTGSRPTIIISTHAPVGLPIIRQLAAHMNVPYNDTTVDDLATTIDRINTKFKRHADHNTISLLRPTDKRISGEHSTNPFEQLMWNRNTVFIGRPSSSNGYGIMFVHGHHPATTGEAHVINLDNNLGKTLSSNEGSYTVFLSPETSALRPAPTHIDSPSCDNTMLLHAVYKREELEVQSLLQGNSGLNINFLGDAPFSQQTPWTLAVRAKHFGIMAALLSYIHKNTDDITTFRSHITSLDSAMKDSFLAFVLTSEQLDLAILLIEFGIQMPHDMAQKNSLLIYAVTQENIAFAHQLIRHGADINILDQTQRALLAETSSLSTASTEIISDDDSGHPAQRAPGANGGISTEQSRRPAFILNARRTLIDTSVFAMVDSVLPAQAAIDTVMNVDPVPPTGQLRRPFTLSARGTRIDANAFESDPDSRPSSPRSAAP